MKYKPTPRDLFNPPPQAHQLGSNWELLRILRETVEEAYPNFFHPVRGIFTGILDILEKYEDERRV
jgi:hypothetical protein